MPRNSLDELLELQLDVLGQQYEIPDKPAILHFLRSHRDVFKLLREAAVQAHRAFNDHYKPLPFLALRLVKDDDLLRVVIECPSWWMARIDPALALLDFERDWWLNNQHLPGGSSLIFAWEYQGAGYFTARTIGVS